MENTSDMVKELIKLKTGEESQYNEPTCVIWKADHKGCEGCSSELPCARVAHIMLASYKGAMYEPKDFEDELKTYDVVTKIIDKIMVAKTVDEVHSI